MKKLFENNNNSDDDDDDDGVDDIYFPVAAIWDQ